MLAAPLISDLAGPELGLGRPAPAAGPVRAADAALRSPGAVRAPRGGPAYERVLRGLRTGLGGPALSRMLRRGGTVALGKAVRLALSGDLPGGVTGRTTARTTARSPDP